MEGGGLEGGVIGNEKGLHKMIHIFSVAFSHEPHNWRLTPTLPFPN